MSIAVNTIIFLFLFASVKNECISKHSLCPELPQCSCLPNVAMVDINCRGIFNFTQVQDVMRRRFQNVTINHILLKDCAVSLLPNEAFLNITVHTVFLYCPIRKVDDHAFLGSEGITQIRLYLTRLDAIPVALRDVPRILQFQIKGGNVQSLNEELYNLTQLRSFSLYNNKLRYLDKEAFRDTKLLKILDLSNNYLQTIENGTLNSLIFLQDLNLSKNRLTSVNGLFQGINPQVINLYHNLLTSVDDAFYPNMLALKELYLGHNGLQDLKPTTFSGKMPNIKLLELKKNNLTQLDPNLFQYLPLLNILDLSWNKFTYLPSNIFRNLISLSTLKMSGNRLTSLKGLFDEVPALTELYLSGNDVESVDGAFSKMSKLQFLILSNNKIRNISEDSFRGLENLKNLSLLENRIVNMSRNCFSDLSQLRIIYLSGNNISNLNQSLNNLPNLAEIVLSFNKIHFLGENEFLGLTNLRNVSFFNNKIKSTDRTFQHLRGLNSIDFSKNKLTTLLRTTFPDIIKIQELRLSGNKWSCDCRLSWMVKWLRETQYAVLKDDPVCHAPPWLWNMNLKDLTLYNFTHWAERCPSVCVCTCIPTTTDMYVSVDCSHRKLTSIPETLPEVVGELLLADNLLKDVRKMNFNALTNLQALDLENNFLYTFSPSLPQELKALKLAGNNLTQFSLDAVDKLTRLQLVTLSRNPWICDCSTVHFKKWLLQFQYAISDVNLTKCGPGSHNKELIDKVIVSLSDSQLCPPPVALYIIVSIGILVFLLCLASVVIAYNRYHLHLKIWLYSRGFTWIKEEDIDTGKLFHAFVSYSNKDETFVVNQLVPGLEKEEPYFQLCLHYKHFLPGEYIHDSINDAVKYSSRTIMVLSRNFLQSEWCKLEFRTAHMQVLEDKINRLIIIIYGDIPVLSDIDPTIKLYLESTTYLTWGEKYFWQKLRYAMPKIKIPKKPYSIQQPGICADETTRLLRE